ncbi:hypothetical protein PO909_029164 [Leuciscus waleckii]
MRRCSSISAQTTGNTYSELYRRLAYPSRVRTSGGSASRCRSRTYEEIGVEIECQEQCTFSSTEDHLSWCRVGFSDNEGRALACSCRFDPHSCKRDKARPVTHCKTVSKAVGSDGSRGQHYTVRPAVHEAPTVVAQDQGVFPEGEPTLYDQDNTAVSPCFGFIEETLVPISGSSVRSSLPSSFALDRRFSHGLESGNGRPLSSRSVEESSSFLAHKLPGDDGGLQCVEIFPSRPEGPSHACSHRQHVGGLLYKSSRGSAFMSTMQTAHQILLWSQGKLLSLRPVYIPGHQNIGADILSRQGLRPGEWRLHTKVVEHIWGVYGQAQVDLFASQDTTHCPLWFSLTHPAPLGLDAMAQTWPRLHLYAFPPDRSAPRSSGEGPPGRRECNVSSSILAKPSVVLEPNIPSRRLSPGAAGQKGPSISGGGSNSPSSPRNIQPVGLASEGAHLIDSGLSSEVVETILNSRAPSTRKLYALKWRVFTSWCNSRQWDPVNCTVGSILEFLLDHFDSGLSPSTLKVYVAAIAAYHAPLGGASVGRHPWVTRFLRGTLRLRPAARSRVPTWDLAIVLEGLAMAPFEPIEEVPEKFLTLKTLFLLSISSLKRIWDLQALSVAPSCLEFAPGMKAFLFSKEGYVPKVPTNVAGPIMLQAFSPPPFQNQDQEKLNLLCPVRALDAYVHRAALWRKSDQLFVCFGSPSKGKPAS